MLCVTLPSWSAANIIYSLRGPSEFPRISLKSTVTRGDALKALCGSTTFAEVLRTSCGLSAGVSRNRSRYGPSPKRHDGRARCSGHPVVPRNAPADRTTVFGELRKAHKGLSVLHPAPRRRRRTQGAGSLDALDDGHVVV
jgi:hypothetical protein